VKQFPPIAIPLLAYAAGDAFGVFYEFLDVPEKNIPQELKGKDGWPFGGVSDDTLLSVLTINSLKKSSPAEAAEEFLSQLKSPKAIECAQIAAGLFAGEEFPDYSGWTPPASGISLDPLETLQAVVWVVKRAENCADAFALACSLGGDTDTVAALSGALFAARWPEKANFYSIPWIHDVAWDEVEDDLMNCADMLVERNG